MPQKFRESWRKTSVWQLQTYDSISCTNERFLCLLEDWLESTVTASSYIAFVFLLPGFLSSIPRSKPATGMNDIREGSMDMELISKSGSLWTELVQSPFTLSSSLSHIWMHFRCGIWSHSRSVFPEGEVFLCSLVSPDISGEDEICPFITFMSLDSIKRNFFPGL